VKGEKHNIFRLKRLKSLLAKTTLATFDNQAQTLDSSDDHHHATLLEGEGDTAAARLLSSHVSKSNQDLIPVIIQVSKPKSRQRDDHQHASGTNNRDYSTGAPLINYSDTMIFDPIIFQEAN
jgi:hypothetical protein